MGPFPRNLIDLKNKVYILIRDKQGVSTTEPARVFKSWGKLRGLVESGGCFGDSIFIGLASQKEALIAVTEGGVSWPSEGEV